jgi:hypothetical protein
MLLSRRASSPAPRPERAPTKRRYTIKIPALGLVVGGICCELIERLSSADSNQAAGRGKNVTPALDDAKLNDWSDGQGAT